MLKKNCNILLYVYQLKEFIKSNLNIYKIKKYKIYIFFISQIKMY